MPARLAPVREKGSTLADLIETILDKGLVINADIAVSVAGMELLSIRIRAALASFETAAKYGLEMPTGTKLERSVWQEGAGGETCPQCGKRAEVKELLEEQCPWCGWKSARSKARLVTPPACQEA